jgi:hypothetical protein
MKLIAAVAQKIRARTVPFIPRRNRNRNLPTESHTEVTSDSLSVSVDYINVENISSFHGNDFEKKLPSNGHCNSSRTEPELNSAFIDYYSDHLPVDSKCSEGHEKCHALFALTRSQRTIIELAEVGLLHAFDCDEAVLEETVESDLRSHFYDGEDADVVRYEGLVFASYEA